MNVISCASYYGTGSSAVTDFISEFSNVKNLTNYEFRFVHDPEGLSDLEYNLVENHNRHNSGHALKRYKRLVDYYGNHFMVRRYEPFFGNKWKKISYEYIEALTDFTYKGYWQYDFIDRGPWFEFWHKLPGRILRKTLWRGSYEKSINVLPNEITYASQPTEEKFLHETRIYTDKLFEAANPENAPYLMVDQIVPPSNIMRYLRYFSNLKVFIVERDPRDLYLLSKYVWNDSIIPKDSIELFCKWYKYTRFHRTRDVWDEEKVILIQFEDLIYKYDETTKKIMKWAGLSEKDHMEKKKYFNPDKSIKNTRLWESNTAYEEEARKIAELLPEYLYKG